MPHIRQYRSSDDVALADVCTKTGDSGGDATGILLDDALWGDLFALPYVHRHPDLAWVVETDDGRVVGYVIGTDDTDAFERWFRDEWWPPRSGRYERVSGRQGELLDYADERAPGKEAHAAGHPAHLHIDLLPEAQGSGFGRKLVQTLLEELRSRGVPALHLGVSPRNLSAMGFYERLGFERLSAGESAVVFGIRL